MKNQITISETKELQDYLEMCEELVNNNPEEFSQFKQTVEGIDLNIIRKAS